MQESLNQSVNNNTSISFQNQLLGANREGNSYIVRSETSGELSFTASGKYTSQVFKKKPLDGFAKRGTIMPDNIEFSFDSTEGNYCSTHNEIKDYILFSKVENFRIFDTICKNCLSQLNRRNPNPAKAELFDSVIIDNKDKILQIRQNKLNLSGGSSAETLNVLKETILPLADELIYLSEVFDAEVLGKIGGNTAKAEEIEKLKGFINSIELTPNGDPNVFGIGKNEPLKHKYIKLALFLVNFAGVGSMDADHSGITESIKSHMVRIIQLRKTIIIRITAWLKYLAGSFYEHAFSLEGIPVDEAFRRNLQIDYVSEEDLLRLKNFFEAELRKRDDRIRFLEDENSKLRREIESLKGNIVVMSSEQESLIAELRLKLQKLEAEWSYQQQTIGGLTNENSRLNGLNAEYLNQIEVFRREIAQLKIDFEVKLRQTLESIKNEYEVKINQFIISINQSKSQFAELENKYNNDVRSWASEREQFSNQIKMLNQRYENDMKSFTMKLESLSAEYNNLKNQNNNYLVQINNYVQEINGLKSNNENFKNQINSLEISIKNYVNTMTILSKERDELRQQLSVAIQERDGFRIQVENFKNQINSLEISIKNYVNNITIFSKERDELRQQLNVVLQERDGFRNQADNLKNQINSSEISIKNYVNNITILSKERDELRQQINVSRGDTDKLRGEISIITNIKISYESRIADFQKKLDDLSGLYAKLHNEYNLKLTIIGNLERKITNLDGTVSSSEGQINMYLITIKKYEEELNRLKIENNELKVKLLIISERDAEISRLKIALTACRDEWTRLSESYEGLLVDIKSQIQINETLRMFIFELQSKIESHNQQIGGLDSAIRQQLEILTRQTLSKKSIEYNQNDAVKKSQNEIEALRAKVGRIESAKFNKSAVFSNMVNLSIDTISRSNNANEITIVNTTPNAINSNSSQYARYYTEKSSVVENQGGQSSTNVNLNNSDSNLISGFRSSYVAPASSTSYNYRSYDKIYGNNVFNSYIGNTGANVESSSFSTSNRYDQEQSGNTIQNVRLGGDTQVIQNAILGGDSQVIQNVRLGGETQVIQNVRLGGDTQVIQNAKLGEETEVINETKCG